MMLAMCALFATGGAAFAYALWLVAERAGRGSGIRIGAAPPAAVLGAVVAVLALVVFDDVRSAIPCAIALVAAVVCALTDARSGYIFDRVVALALAFTFAAGSTSFVARAEGALAVAGLYAIPYVLTRGRGFGLGDVKLGAVVGAGLGVGPGVESFGASFIIGAVVGVVLLVRGRDRKDAVPFGPFIAVGAVAGLLAYRVGAGVG